MALTACTATQIQSHVASGDSPLCAQTADLGRIAVVPETAWRANQKDRDERTAMATGAIRRAFSDLGCGSDLNVREFASWSSSLEADQLRRLSDDGVDTAIFIRVEELGPTLAITLSVPFLWVGLSEAQVGLRAIHIPTQRVLLDARIRRVRGGPFQLRPASWAQAELEGALVSLVQGMPARR